MVSKSYRGKKTLKAGPDTTTHHQYRNKEGKFEVAMRGRRGSIGGWHRGRALEVAGAAPLFRPVGRYHTGEVSFS